MTDHIPDRDWDRLSTEARALLCLLAGLREGRMIEDAAARLERVVDGVLDEAEENDKGEVKGPKGTLTITVEVAPVPTDIHRSTVRLRDRVANKYPEERTHDVYVGKKGTLHTRHETIAMLFGVTPTESGELAVVYPPDAAAGPDA